MEIVLAGILYLSASCCGRILTLLRCCDKFCDQPFRLQAKSAIRSHSIRHRSLSRSGFPAANATAATNLSRS